MGRAAIVACACHEDLENMSLTSKLILGFVFALVLQVLQMFISGYFAARMQKTTEQVSSSLSASMAVQSAVDAVRDLRMRMQEDVAVGSAHVSPKVYRVYLEEIAAQARVLTDEIGSGHSVNFQAVAKALDGANSELEVLESQVTGKGSIVDEVAFLDDQVGLVEQALLGAQIQVRELAIAGMQRERGMRDLPMRAGIVITLGGVVLMSLFIAWFSRQLVIPIQRAWSELEHRVAARTAELAATVGELEGQIVERRKAEAQKEELHQQLVDASRRAGMAELANGVLHNVGNVLNSVNISAGVLLDRLGQSRSDGLQRAVQLLREHETDLAEFLTASAQGKKLPAYLEKVAAHLLQERDVLVGEARDLSVRIDHMKDIVHRQQSYARVSGVTSFGRLSAVVEDVLRMQQGALAEHGIRVETKFLWDEEFEMDRSRVLQILLNLMSNARQATVQRGGGEGLIRVDCELVAEQRVRLRVLDHGVGISAENLAKVFGHGFTTKRDGHGFGLHHSANAAAEMGGRLWAESQGEGRGACFCLELPVGVLVAGAQT